MLAGLLGMQLGMAIPTAKAQAVNLITQIFLQFLDEENVVVCHVTTRWVYFSKVSVKFEFQAQIGAK
jgi:hypothetical protein